MIIVDSRSNHTKGQTLVTRSQAGRIGAESHAIMTRLTRQTEDLNLLQSTPAADGACNDLFASAASTVPLPVPFHPLAVDVPVTNGT